MRNFEIDISTVNELSITFWAYHQWRGKSKNADWYLNLSWKEKLFTIDNLYYQFPLRERSTLEGMEFKTM